MYIVYNKDTGEIYSKTNEKPVAWTNGHIMKKIADTTDEVTNISQVTIIK